MRIHVLLITALLSVLTFDIHAASASGAAPPSTVKTVSPDTCTNKLMSQSNYMKGLMEQIQSLIKRIKAVIDNQPHPPNTRGMNPDDAEELKRQYQNALDQWRLRLTKLQNKLKATQKKLIKAENELKATKRDCHKKQNGWNGEVDEGRSIPELSKA